MKRLVTAGVVRAEHAAGKKRISVTRSECIVTPEARSVAEQLGVAIAEDASCALDASDCCGAAASPQEPGVNDDLSRIRAAVLAQLPQGAVSADAVDQLVRKVVAEQNGKKTGAGQARDDRTPSSPTYDADRIAGGIKRISGTSVRLGRFEGAGEDKQVDIADVVTAEDGSAIAAGFMKWEKCFFPWTLNYDEVDYVIDGELHIRSEGQCVVGKPGDVIFIPKGSRIEFGTPSRVHFLYVAYPANWSEC